MIDQGVGTVARASRSTDMYAFAMLIFYVLTQKCPFDGVSLFALQTQVLKGIRPSVDDLPSNTPPAIVKMMNDCWSVDRKKRMSAAQCYGVLQQARSVHMQGSFDLFFSHAWIDKALLSHVYRLLVREGYKVWYDQYNSLIN